MENWWYSRKTIYFPTHKSRFDFTGAKRLQNEKEHREAGSNFSLFTGRGVGYHRALAHEWPPWKHLGNTSSYWFIAAILHGIFKILFGVSLGWNSFSISERM